MQAVGNGTTTGRMGELADGATAPSRDDFRRLYLAHLDLVHRYVANRRWDAPDAGDVVAEVFAVAWRRRDDLPADEGRQRAWLLGVARRVLADHRRSDRRRRRLVQRLAGEEEARDLPGRDGADGPAGALADRLEMALGRLSERDQELLRLLAWDELPRAEVAAALGCTVNALNIRVHRALRRLARQLGEEPDAHHDTIGDARGDDFS
jgi:RNA polymerase sigma factor (sigma-70 family)